MKRRSPILLALALLVAGSERPLRAQEVDTAGNTREDWLRFVPNDVGFYAELNDLEGIRQRFSKLGVWETVRELAEGGDASTPGVTRSERLLGMTPEAAIAEVLGRRAALIAPCSADWQRGVILAELPSAAEVRRLLRQWRAKRLAPEGDVRTYSLRDGLRLAVRDRLIVLGPAVDNEHLWQRTVLLLAGRGGRHLGAHSGFAGLRAMLGKSYDGLIYSAWPENDPFAFAGCQRLLVGLSFSGREVRCELRGWRRGVEEHLVPWDVEVAAALPATTLASWSGSFRTDLFQNPPPDTALGDKESLIGLFVGTLSGLNRQSERILEKLGPRVTVAVGPDASAAAGDFHMPSAAVVCETQDAGAIVEHLDLVIGFFAKLVTFMAKSGSEKPRLSAILKRQIEGVDVRFVRLGDVLARRLELPFLKKIEVCWASLDDRIVFATRTAYMEQIIRASRGKIERLDAGELLPATSPERDSDAPLVEWSMLRGEDLAAVLATWLDYLAGHHPESLRDEAWRAWARARLADGMRLGIGLASSADNAGRAVVREVASDSPASGILKVGDLIVAAAGEPLPERGSATEVARRYERRGQATVFSVRVLREGEPLELQIPVRPMPAIDLTGLAPVKAMRQVITLMSCAEVVTIARHGTDAERLDVDVRIRWRKTAPADVVGDKAAP